jgi:alginate O-acetyltransferase complex protein AlgI
VLWGGYHGVLLTIERAVSPRLRIPRAAGIAVTLFLVVNGWVLFRARDLGVFLQMLRAMYLPRADLKPTVGTASMSFVVLAFLATIVLMSAARWAPGLIDRVRASATLTGVGYGVAAACAITFVLLRNAPTAFIYFRF